MRKNLTPVTALLLAVFLAVLVFTCVSCKDSKSEPVPEPTLPSSTAGKLDRLVSVMMEQNDIPGVIAGVWIAGVGSWTTAVGLSDIREGGAGRDGPPVPHRQYHQDLRRHGDPATRGRGEAEPGRQAREVRQGLQVRGRDDRPADAATTPAASSPTTTPPGSSSRPSRNRSATGVRGSWSTWPGRVSRASHRAPNGNTATAISFSWG